MWKAYTKDFLFKITKRFHFDYEPLNNFLKSRRFFFWLFYCLSIRWLYANERKWFVKKNEFIYFYIHPIIPLLHFYGADLMPTLVCARANRNWKLHTHTQENEECAIESILWHIAKINESKEWLSTELKESLWIARKSKMTINFWECESKNKFAIKKREREKSHRDWMASTCEIFKMDLRDILRYLV